MSIVQWTIVGYSNKEAVFIDMYQLWFMESHLYWTAMGLKLKIKTTRRELMINSEDEFSTAS